MRLLLDTHVWIWLMSSPERLKAQTLATLAADSNSLWLSMASIWETAIKEKTGKLSMRISFDDLVRTSLFGTSLHLLPIDARHAMATRDLPLLHRDPFDRMLVAQA